MKQQAAGKYTTTNEWRLTGTPSYWHSTPSGQPLVEYAVFVHRHLTSSSTDTSSTVRALCEAALNSGGDSAEALMRVAWLRHVALEDAKGARKLMQRALRLDPNNARVHRVDGTAPPLLLYDVLVWPNNSSILASACVHVRFHA